MTKVHYNKYYTKNMKIEKAILWGIIGRWLVLEEVVAEKRKSIQLRANFKLHIFFNDMGLKYLDIKQKIEDRKE